MKYCPKCGKKLINANLKYCPECGVALSAPKEVPAPEVAKVEAPAQQVTKIEAPAPTVAKKTGFFKKLLYLLLILILIALAAYITGALFPPNNSLLVATFMEGPVSGAAVRAYALSDNGTKGELLAGPVYSDKDGMLELNLSHRPPYILVESSGGSYYEDAKSGGRASLVLVKLSSSYFMRSIVPSDAKYAIVTPFSNMASALASKSMSKGAAAEKAVQFANRALSQQYRIRSVTGTLPAAAYDSNATATAVMMERDYGLLLAGLVQDARNLNVKTADLAQALARDWSDGRVDGTEDGNLITLNDNAGKLEVLSPGAGLKLLQEGINEFMEGPSDATNLQQFPISLTPVCGDPDFYISTTTLPSWIEGQFGSFSLTAVGGTPPYTWSIKEGSTLPQGFDLSPDGNLSGTGSLAPGSAESISPPFTVVVTDSSSPPKKCESELRIDIAEHPPDFEPVTVECEVDKDCAVSLASQVTGGMPPYHFVGYSSSSGPYPLDLMLWLDGTIRGKPSEVGTYAIQACAVDMIGWESCKDVTIIVNEKPKPTCNKTCSAGQQQKPAPDCSCYTPTPPTPTCEPGHRAVYCGGRWQCCLNSWVCCGGSCSPPAFC